MKSRPFGRVRIIETHGSNDIIVVIPTASFAGKYAQNCKINIFTGMHIIFVESGKIPDPYFNYAHNMNIGISCAMKYNPKWIIISNDDMYKIDDVSVLLGCLKENTALGDVILARKNNYYKSNISEIKSTNFLAKILIRIISRMRVNNVNLNITSLLLFKKFNIKFISGLRKISSRDLLLNKITEVWNINNFAIFSSTFIQEKGGLIFDETFINGYEDIDLSLRLLKEKRKIDFIDYKIGDYSGSSLGLSRLRSAREIANLAYFNSKYTYIEKNVEISGVASDKL